MRANKYFKKYGIYSAKRLVETAPLDKRETPNINYEKGNAYWHESILDICVDVQKLKRLIESHEIVQKYKKYANPKLHFIADYFRKSILSPFDNDVYDMVGKKYDQAIADVDSCQ